MKKALKQHPDVPELQAQMAEVQRLLKDLREGLAALSGSFDEQAEA